MENNKRLTPEDFLYMESKVLEWNTLFGNDPSNKELISVYDGLVKEELNETLKAFEEGNEPEIIDGLCDLMYVAGFRWMLEGEEMDNTFLQDVYHNTYNYVGLEDSLHCLEETWEDPFCLQTELIILLSGLSNKYNTLESFNRVTDSNFSKAISKKDVDSGKINLDVCIESVYNGGRYDEIYYEESNDYFIIKAKVDKHEDKVYPTGKVCKGGWYKSVEDLGGLEEFIY